MNTFYEHHKDSIRFQYACFDRILLSAAIPLLLEPTGLRHTIDRELELPVPLPLLDTAQQNPMGTPVVPNTRSTPDERTTALRRNNTSIRHSRRPILISPKTLTARRVAGENSKNDSS